MSLPHTFRIGRAGAGGGGAIEALGSNDQGHPSGGTIINDGYGLVFFQQYNTNTHDGNASPFSFSLDGDTTLTIRAIAGGGGGSSYSDQVTTGDRTGVNPVNDSSRGGGTVVSTGGAQIAFAQGGYAGFSRQFYDGQPIQPQLPNPPATPGPASTSFTAYPGGRGGQSPDQGPGSPGPIINGSPGAGGGGGGGLSGSGGPTSGGTAQYNSPTVPGSNGYIRGADGGVGIDGNSRPTQADAPGYNTGPQPAPPMFYRGGGGGAGHRAEGGYGGAAFDATANYTAGDTINVNVGRGGRGFQNNQSAVRPGSAPAAYGDFNNGVGGHGAVIITWPAP